jgi:hypothetical protein
MTLSFGNRFLRIGETSIVTVTVGSILQLAVTFRNLLFSRFAISGVNVDGTHFQQQLPTNWATSFVTVTVGSILQLAVTFRLCSFAESDKLRAPIILAISIPEILACLKESQNGAETGIRYWGLEPGEPAAAGCG